MAAQTLTATRTRPATVARLVADVNALVEPTGGVYNCPVSSGGLTDPGADLSFVTPNGRAIPVTITPGCPPVVVVAKRYNLSLVASTLWTDVVAAVGYPRAGGGPGLGRPLPVRPQLNSASISREAASSASPASGASAAAKP